jgi:hypothetical protein
MYSLLCSASITVAFFVASALLVGCASSGPQVEPSVLQSAVRMGLNTNAATGRPLTSPLSGEVFTASNVTVKNTICINYDVKTSFTASGKVRGPYPGTFTASGLWQAGQVAWGFSESFMVTSGTSTIAGTIHGSSLGRPPFRCLSFGPADGDERLTYSSGSWSGSASIAIISAGNLRERLH